MNEILARIPVVLQYLFLASCTVSVAIIVLAIRMDSKYPDFDDPPPTAGDWEESP